MEGLGVVWAIKHLRHYIYDHHCTVYTDHTALKSLLNTPQPSAKLARWGMALQELDLQIEYWPSKANARADALSRYPIFLLHEDVAQTQTNSIVVALKVAATRSEPGGGGSGEILSQWQRQDLQLADIMTYSETGDHPQDEKRARKLVLSRSMFTMQDGIL